MRRSIPLIVLFFALFAPVSAQQVQAIGDVSFAVPVGFSYTQGPDFGAMSFKDGNRFWLIAVYTPTPCSGNLNADFKAAWRRVVLSLPDYKTVPSWDPYDISKTVGYPGKYYDDTSVSGQSHTRLHVLQAGKSCIPVSFTSGNRQMLDGMWHIGQAVVGSVRLAPLRATPLVNSIKISDLTGEWTAGIVNSIDYYNRSTGQYTGNSFSAVKFGYTIAANGSYTYKFGGMMNNRMTSDDDSGVIELGGEFITFKGRKYVRRHRFMFLEQALDGSTVLLIFPDRDMSTIDAGRDGEYYTRAAKK